MTEAVLQKANIALKVVIAALDPAFNVAQALFGSVDRFPQIDIITGLYATVCNNKELEVAYLDKMIYMHDL